MDIRTITFTKDGQQFVFRYEVGFEHEVVEALMALAGSDANVIDWLDAATLSFQITCGAAADCAKTLSPLQ